ncbi:pyridoxal-phosphate dependent enzyme [Streptomyces sp. NPDC057638]|uniref:pyridoxal-phosphate dependent enzyme n=1 Tax=Streptomyces sp. NPDC057638 TaxID=3346190 RepID=UPI0036B6F96D
MTQVVYPGIVSTIGDTPLLETTGLIAGFQSRIYVKLERHNPGGSIEDRTALSLVRTALQRGAAVPGSSLAVEICSPERAVSLAQVCRYYGIAFLALLKGAPEPYRSLLTAYGADFEVLAPGTAHGRLAHLLATDPRALCPSSGAGPRGTGGTGVTSGDSALMREIAEALEGRVDLVLCELDHPRTLGGCAEYARTQGLATTVVGVVRAPASLPCGPLTVPFGVDEVVRVRPEDAARMRGRLLHREGLLADTAAGAGAAALLSLARRIPAGSNCVIVSPSGGDRCPENFEHKDATPC